MHEGDTIALDTGDYNLELAKLLVTYENLTVVTNDLQIAAFPRAQWQARTLLWQEGR